MERITIHGGVELSALGFGAMSLSDAYGPISDDEAASVIAAARDAGITLYDTANIYGDGRSERMLGTELLPSVRRDQVTIASKFGIVRGGGVGNRSIRGDRAYVFEQIDLTLQRLGTDYVDLYYVHRIDRDVGIEETVGAVAELVTAGKVRAIGLSEASGTEIRRAHAIHPIAAVQSEWSLFSRDVEENVLAVLVELGIVMVPYAPLSRALLTGTLTHRRFVPPDIRAGFPRFAPEALGANLDLVAELAEIARAEGASPAQLALAWIGERSRELSLQSVSIPGTRSPEHLQENVRALDLRVSDATMRSLDGFSARVTGLRNARALWTSQGRE